MNEDFSLGKVALFIMGTLVFFSLLAWGLGWFGVGYTKTVGKAKVNAEREVYMESASYVNGKKQEITKLYREYHSTKDEEEKSAIADVVASRFAEFDVSSLKGPENNKFRDFITACVSGEK